MADTARSYPSESLVALEGLAETLAAVQGADIVANAAAGLGTGDIEVSAYRLAFGFGGCRTEPGGRIERRLSGIAWPPADALPQAMEAGR